MKIVDGRPSAFVHCTNGGRIFIGGAVTGKPVRIIDENRRRSAVGGRRSYFHRSGDVFDPGGFEVDVTRQLQNAVGDVFAIHDITVGQSLVGGLMSQQTLQAVRLRGRLLMDSEQAYRIVSQRFRDLGYTPLFRREDGMDVILALPGGLPKSEARLWLAGGLFVATALSMLLAWIGLGVQEAVQYTVSLLTILVAHELGHYLVARFYGVAVSLPYFIPMPFSLLGTLGAVINMKAPPTNRRQLLHIAVAGPLAGFVMAVPILLWGLSISPVKPIGPGLLEGNSILYAVMKILVFGRFLPDGRFDVYLSPMAFAGWTGLLVTAFNLLPVGTLDGGHIIYALFGERAQMLMWPIVGVLLLLGMRWNGWWLWVVLIMLFGRYHAVPLDDITGLDDASRIVGAATLALLILTFVPVPFSVVR